MKIKQYLSFFFFLCAVPTVFFAQINDECVNNIFLANVADYCSTVGEYNNQMATPSPQVNPGCFPVDANNDVWFAFKAIGTDVKIRVVGAAGNNFGGTMQNPQFALYSGDCTNLTEEQCFSDAFGANIAESFAGPLVVGQNYFIRIGARNTNVGTFQLCVTNFNSVPEPSSDCPTGVVLCDKQAFSVESLSSVGSLTNELTSDDCIGQEFSSAWYKWTCDQAGSLSFILNPGNPNDDLDFSVYELPNGIDDCVGKVLLRCVASGENVGQPFADWQACTGATGLSESDNDTSEAPGCGNGDNNFASAVNMETGKSYALIVNNFSNSGFGFDIQFGGSGTFLGPQPDFLVNPEEGTQCDIDMVTFEDNSVIPAGFTASYQWFFGEDAIPAIANTPGPHEVLYESFGTKSILLQITTEEGCIVTQVRDIFIEACCPPDANLDIQLDETVDPLCADEATGSVTVSGIGGVPAYQYSLDGINFQQGSMFSFVPAGDFEIFIVDKKGCLDSIDVLLNDPPPLIVDAGEDFTIDLGETVELNGSLISSDSPTGDPMWTPSDNIIEDSLTYSPLLLPFGTMTYTLTVIDELGCTDLDTTTVFVIPIRPVYVPNAFTPNEDGINDFFTLYGGAGATSVRYLRVFNRWGGLVYENTDFSLNQEALGWDGYYRGKRLGTDVFAYVAEVEFIDGVTLLLKGDISLVR
ncbi:MAG: gliding motility-associated-like protein [Saprospiraceae bacterium]|jgi:gliding motility-associated-like protein